MARLTTRQRNAVPKSKHGLPSRGKGKGSFPMPDKAHARAAEMDAGISKKKGNISLAQKKQIDAKARNVLGGGKKKAAPRKRR